MAGEAGIRIVTFEACSGFTHVTARRIAQPPIGDLCHEAPVHAVSTTLRVDSPSTDDSRLRGALPGPDLMQCSKDGGRIADAVGTRVASRPPHRSVQAAFPHTAPTSGMNG